MYTPPQKILDKYADLLVNFAPRLCKGIKKGDTVYLVGTEVTKPLFLAVKHAIIKAGGNVFTNYMPNECDRYQNDVHFYTHASDAQLKYFPKKFYKGIVDEMDHMIYLIGETNPHALKNVDPKKVSKRVEAFKPFMQMRDEKQLADRFTWTLAFYGTEAMAKEAGLTEKEYWDQIIKACFLDKPNPKKAFQKIYKEMQVYCNKLNKISDDIEYLHIEGKDADLKITPGESRTWISARGFNIPSFEIFMSPDWRGTEGWIRFSEPLYRHGNVIKGIELHFKKGKVVKATAKKNEKLLKEIVRTKHADKVGEFSLTDKRHSRITKFMANTLFDENMGGPEGNTHIALGRSYRETYAGDIARMQEKDWGKLGFNYSAEHCDIMSTTKRKVTAYMRDGSTKLLYQDGEFVL